MAYLFVFPRRLSRKFSKTLSFLQHQSFKKGNMVNIFLVKYTCIILCSFIVAFIPHMGEDICSTFGRITTANRARYPQHIGQDIHSIQCGIITAYRAGYLQDIQPQGRISTAYIAIGQDIYSIQGRISTAYIATGQDIYIIQGWMTAAYRAEYLQDVQLLGRISMAGYFQHIQL